MIKISIIIPIYNAQKYIRRCLESILRQTYEEIEIICVDDCSIDESISVVEQYQKKYGGKIKILYSKVNTGQGIARDRGVEIATGEYITFVDSDDYIKKDFIETYIKVAEKVDADIIVGGYIRNVNGKCRKYPVNNLDNMYMWTNVNVWSKIYRKSFLLENNLHFGKIRRYEDEIYVYRLMMKNPKVKLIPYIGYFYWMNPDSTTRNNKYDRTKICMEYMRQIDIFYKTESVRAEYKKKLQYCILSSLTANLLYNGKGCKIKRMNQLYKVYYKICMRIDKNIWSNQYVSLAKVKSEPIKKRYAVCVVSFLHRFGCGRLAFWIASLL